MVIIVACCSGPCSSLRDVAMIFDGHASAGGLAVLRSLAVGAGTLDHEHGRGVRAHLVVPKDVARQVKQDVALVEHGHLLHLHFYDYGRCTELTSELRPLAPHIHTATQSVTTLHWPSSLGRVLSGSDPYRNATTAAITTRHHR